MQARRPSKQAGQLGREAPVAGLRARGQSSASWTGVGLAITWAPLTGFLIREVRLGPGDAHLQ